MQVKVQVITLRDDGEESLQEVACVEHDELTPASLGLSIADSKAILQGCICSHDTGHMWEASSPHLLQNL